MRHLGIYSGTFDPIHKGHISFALNAIKLCGLGSVVFLPEKIPRNKHSVTAFTIRINAISKALDTYHELKVHDIAVDQFTVKKTLSLLQKQFPDYEITLLIGSDVALHLPQWKDLTTLIETFNLAIGMRNTETKQQVVTAMQRVSELCGLEPSYILIDTAHGSVSSSQYKHKERNA